MTRSPQFQSELKPGDLRLVTLRVANHALAGEAPPARLKLLAWGDNPSTKGIFRVTDLTVSQLPANQAKLGFDKIALDWEHNTVPGSPEYERTKEPRSIAAHGIPEVIPGDGLYLANLVWTPDGLASWKNFPDLSPCVHPDHDGAVTFIHSAALTRAGAVDGLEFLSASVPQPSTLNHQPNTMTDQEIQAAIKAAIEAAVTPLNAKLDALKPADLTPLSARLDRVEAAEKNKLVLLFAEQGKQPKDKDGNVLSAESLGKLSFEDLKLLHANSPANVIPLSARTGNPSLPNQSAAPDPEKLQKRAQEIKAARNCSFEQAWNQALTETK